MLVSCHREENLTKGTQSEYGYPIEFSGISGSIETRADGDQIPPLPDDFTDFRVWAELDDDPDVFGANGTKVSTSNKGQTWAYSPVRYWKDGTYNFYAVYQKNITKSF